MRFAVFFIAVLFAAISAPVPRGEAQLLEMLSSPKTLVDRAIEARSAEDIVEDNRIVLALNKLMAELGTLNASTEIYEQHLLITGIFDDKAIHDKFRAGVDKVKGIKKLYWHAVHMPEAQQKKRKGELVDWKDTLVIGAKVRAGLIGTRGVADVNYKTAVDSFATVYVLGRARSGEEMKKALDAVRGAEGVRKVVNYAYVKP